MPKLTDDEMALIAQALRSYSALIRNDAERMSPNMADPVKKGAEAARAMAERFAKRPGRRPSSFRHGISHLLL
jgi:hypothetical protein